MPTYPSVKTSRVTISVDLSDQMWLDHSEYDRRKAGSRAVAEIYGVEQPDPDFEEILYRLEKLAPSAKVQEWTLSRFEVEVDFEDNTPDLRKRIYMTVGSYITEAKQWLKENKDNEYDYE